MTFLLILVYFSLLLVPLLKKNKDFFSPPVLFVITMSFYTVPDILEILLLGESKFVSSLPFKIDNPFFSIQRFLFLQIIFVLFYYAGYNLYLNRRIRVHGLRKRFDAIHNKLNLYIGIIGLLICTITTYSFISSMGGYQELLLSFTNRVELEKNMTFLQSNLSIIMTMCSAFLVKYITHSKKNHIILLLFLIIVGFFTNTIGGGRSKFVVFILSILCYFNYWRSKINLFDKKYFVLYGFLAIFILVFQLLRYSSSDDMSLDYMYDNSDALFDSMAYAKTQLLIQSYFDTHTFWWGKTYTFLAYIFIPSSIFPDKPHIDEGVYIYNMMYNYPEALSNSTFICSWPPFTAGISYANWGVIGLILGGILLGCLHAFMYKKIKEYNYSIFILIIYVFIVLKFQFTVFYICHTIYLIIETYFMFLAYKFLSSVR